MSCSGSVLEKHSVFQKEKESIPPVADTAPPLERTQRAVHVC